MSDLVDYDSDLYVYDDVICYDHPDCEIIIQPEEIKHGETGGSASSGYYIEYPNFTPAQMLNWLETLKKKKIKIKVNLKVNDKEHISFTRIIEKDNLKDIKDLTAKVEKISESIFEKNKKIYVYFNKVEKIS